MVGTDQNVVTEMRYGPGSLLRELVALNPATGPQVTRYEHGVALGESAVASNRLLRAEIYPDAADSADRISYAWNRQGQRTRMTDQNGTVHEYEYDLLARPTADKVPALGSDVDAAVQRIDTAYEVRGMMKKVTSYSDPNALSAVNEVSNDYNSFTQISAQYQVHDGSLSSGSAQVVQYEYESGATNTIRPTFLYYPSSQYVNYRYDDEASNKLSRVEALQLNGQEVCRYSYLGLSTFVTTQYPEPQIEYNFATGSGADRYAGLDRFGRVLNALWQYTGDSGSSSSGSGPAALVDLQYGYDRASNRIHRKDLVARSFDQGYDELYEYDGLNRLQKFHRGRLTDDNRTIEAPQLQQGWVLDALGNWQNFTQNDQVDATKTLDQQRISNRVNEITQIARAVGEQWLTPQYSRTGNMTVIPKTEEPTAGMAALHDAWNRLMQLDNPSSNCTYDGLNRRITKTTAAAERHYYYSTAWQILEERREGSASGSSSSSSGPSSSLDRLYVWGLRYIDDLILREWQLESSPQRHYALQDANWNVVALTDASGGVAERYSYTAYGVPMFLNSDFTAKASSDYDWNVLYAGYKWDAQSGMYQVRYRYLLPLLGCWGSRDPIGIAGDINIYRYCHNITFILTDHFGLECCGPDVTSWYVNEVRLFRRESKNIKKRYKKRLNDAYQAGHGGLGIMLDAKIELYQEFARLAVKSDYKARTFSSNECKPACEHTVTLAGKCVGTNQLGNIMYGIIAYDLDMIDDARAYGRGDVPIHFRLAGKSGPSTPWTDKNQGHRETAFDIGIEYAKTGRYKGLMNLNSSTHPVDYSTARCNPCSGIFNGPQTDFATPALVAPDGNMKKPNTEPTPRPFPIVPGLPGDIIYPLPGMPPSRVTPDGRLEPIG